MASPRTGAILTCRHGCTDMDDEMRGIGLETAVPSLGRHAIEPMYYEI